MLFVSTFIFGQTATNYLAYFNLCISGDKAFYYKNYDLAFKYYDSAFSSAQYCHSFNLEKASIAATKTKNKIKAIQYLRQSILNGKNPNILKKQKIQKIKKILKI